MIQSTSVEKALQKEVALTEVDEFRLENLLNDVETLIPMLIQRINQKDWLNAYLLAAGINQVMEDYLHPNILRLGGVEKYISTYPKPLREGISTLARNIQKYLLEGMHFSISVARVRRWQQKLLSLIEELARSLIHPETVTDMQAQAYIELGEAFQGASQRFPPRLLHSILRIPSCFRSFDQHPDDIYQIVTKFVARWPEVDTPIFVVGIRTSGNYLGPLYQAYFREAGYQDVRILTLRPETPLLSSETATIKDLTKINGRVVICDDPPSSGNTLIKAIKMFRNMSIPEQNIILLLQLFGTCDSIPESIRQYQAIVLPWDQWAVHQKLAPEHIRGILARIDPKYKIDRIVRLNLNEQHWERGHVHALYKIRWSRNIENHTREGLIFVEGVGLGYFGQHALAVYQKLPEYFPEVYGYHDGLLIQEGLPDSQRIKLVHGDEEKSLAKAMQDYVIARKGALPVKNDSSRLMGGQNPVWEIAGDILSRVFGHWAFLSRLLWINPIVRQILTVKHPSIVDGEMALSHWYSNNDTRHPIIKTGYARRAFSNLNLACYDPVYDLAGIARSYTGSDTPSELRESYEDRTGETISPEKWYLYRLIHLWDWNRRVGLDQRLYRREAAHLLQQYFYEVLFKDLEIIPTGPLVAFDIDGVLETAPLGFPGLSPSSAKALYALNKHGYRVVLATGRSLSEVRERCLSYRLAGGVAEYGSGYYITQTDSAYPLLNVSEKARVDQFREIVNTHTDLIVNPDFELSVRVYSQGEGDKPTGLSKEVAQKLLKELGEDAGIRPEFGVSQTDFISAQVNKGTGLSALVSVLNPEQDLADGPFIEFAVGDSIPDLAMFEEARAAYSPANADPGIQKSKVHIIKHEYQAGTYDSVSHFLGHKPGHCPICLLPQLSDSTRYLFDILSTQEDGWKSIAPQALRQLIHRVKISMGSEK
jgi:hydroxymethylpyrimidine pyrophosphatase-like HAD family hydrolase